VTFTAGATGTGPFTYSWAKNGATIAGQTGSTLTIGSAATTDSGDYTVTVTNAGGSTTSPATHLTVNPPVGTGIALASLCLQRDLHRK
jgi:hypothetical protein